MATRIAASASNTDIQTQLDLSSPGDTVVIPPETATWITAPYTGGHGLGIPAGVHLRGSGIDSTIITDQCGAGSFKGAIYFVPGSGTQISNFRINAADSGYSQNLVSIPGGTLNFKISDMYLGNVVVRGVHVTGGVGAHPTGVVWNTTLEAKSFPGSPGAGVFQLATVSGPDYASYSTPPTQTAAAGSWAYAPGFGTGEAVFFEDCNFIQDAQGDSGVETYFGGKVVIRHSEGTNLWFGVHGRDSGVRSGHSVEFYNNTVSIDLGNFYPGLMNSRGGTGVVWGNTLTQSADNGSSVSGNLLVLQDYRAAGNKRSDSGTHTGSNGASVLTDATAAWAANTIGGTSTTTGYDVNYIYNTTTGASGVVTVNTSTTLTATLTGGTRQDWNTGDTYITVSSRFPYHGNQNDGHNPYDGNQAVANGTGTHTGGSGEANLTDATKSWGANELDGTGDYTMTNTLRSYFIWNMTSGAGAFISANTATTATTALTGGSRQTWSTGDVYVITFGYPGLDQNGWAGPTSFATFGQGSQVLTPWYSWDNTFNGTPNQLPFSVSYTDSSYTSIAQPDSTLFIQEGREYFDDGTPMPGYTPYAYPHPLRPDAVIQARGRNNPVYAAAAF